MGTLLDSKEITYEEILEKEDSSKFVIPTRLLRSVALRKTLLPGLTHLTVMLPSHIHKLS